MKILKEARELSPKKKRVLIWTIVVMLGFFLFKNYINNLQNKIKILKEKNLNENYSTQNGFSEISKKAEEKLKEIEKDLQKFMEKVKANENQKNEAENESQ